MRALTGRGKSGRKGKEEGKKGKRKRKKRKKYVLRCKMPAYKPFVSMFKITPVVRCLARSAVYRPLYRRN